MNKSHSTHPAQFGSDVFPCELEQIRKRRKNLDLPDVPPESVPSTELGLIGLALSGGGIRSATFSLGVIQALAKHGVLKKVDYLSTVSGGGFIGSCLSSVLNAKNAGTEQDRFPLHYQVGTEEPLGVGQLRNSAHYLSPGGFLDKVRLPALVLRGALSNLFIFLLIILMLVLATEIVYEVGLHQHVPFRNLILGSLSAFIVLVIGFPAIARWFRGGSTWTQRHYWDMTFTVILLLVMFTLFLVPVFILVDQAIDTSWVDMRESLTANLLHPFEGRDYIQWLFLVGILSILMLAGRASRQVSQLGGKIILIALGLLGPAILGMIYLTLVVLQIDSPFITPDELFSLNVEYVEDLSDEKINPDLRRRFKENKIRLSKNAEVITLQKDVRWLIRDHEHAFSLVREQGELSVYPDFQDALSRGKIPPGLVLSMEKKGYILDTVSSSAAVLRDNQYEISGSKLYSIDYDKKSNAWSLEQVVDPAILVDILESTSYNLQIMDSPSKILINEDALLSDDDRELAIRFVEEGNLHDVVVIVDNSTPPFEKPEEFMQTFRKALEPTLKDIRATVRMAVFWFDDDVHQVVGFTSLTETNKQSLVQTLYGDSDQSEPHLDFKGQQSNIPAALVRAMREITEKGRPRVKKSILLISDGIIDINEKDHHQELENWIKGEFADDVASAGVSFYGIALSEKAVFPIFHTLARKTRGAFYPVFESHDGGVKFEDVFGAMEKLKESVGSRLMTPLRHLFITDQRDNTQYKLTRSENGIRIHLVLKGNPLRPVDLTKLTNRVREVFEAQSIDLSEDTTIRRVSDGHWEVSDPYRYIISRSNHKLKISTQETDQPAGFLGQLAAFIPSSLWDHTTDWIFLGVLLILLLYWFMVDVNVTAAHRFYRDRLSKAYLFSITKSGTIEHNDKQKLSGLNSEGSVAPYHLINVTLNLQGSTEPSLRGRYSDFFIFSKCFTGGTRTGYMKTEQLEQYDRNLDLGTAMAISGAAASPNMGVTTVKPLVFIMTMLNIRLGYWLPNPRTISDASWLARLGLHRGPGPKHVLKEAIGHVDARGEFVNVSDGGHIENLGIYELLRRRCKFIIAVDGEADPNMIFNSLVKLQLYARLDMGIEIELDLDSIRSDAKGLSKQQWVSGKIRYGDNEVGHLLYIKSSVTGDEYEYVRAYRAKHPAFPHEPTSDQFFSETQFEAYRALGYQIGDQVLANDQALGEFILNKSVEHEFSTKPVPN